MNDKYPLVSVIIPIYKVEKWLPRCLDSVTACNYKNLEIICVNDGSPDRCGEVLREYASKDDRIVIVEQENQGIPAARNAGLAQAAGDYIAMIDSDDYIHHEYFRSMMRCMLDRKADIVICGCRKFTDVESDYQEHVQHAHYTRLTPETFFKSYYARHMVWGRIYRKEILRNARFISGVRLGEDTQFNLNIVSSLEDPRIYETNVRFYNYYLRDSSIFHTAKAEHFYDIVNCYLSENELRDYGNHPWNWMLLMQAIKCALSYRYACRFERDGVQKIQKINNDLDRLIWEMNWNPHVQMKTKIIHNLMAACPELYRQFRLYNDPTMKIWESRAIEKRKGDSSNEKSYSNFHKELGK